ncbi:TadE/TadG family type IV pilus assembly protein [Sandaracinus amylolyticus]|nr:hypothetical protein [Sandaracinus amylolyticus]UJR83813.1 Hypothetical protein I5071_58840 [Sandaracinus amylolyticus]
MRRDVERSLLRDTRGAAYAEAVLVIPVFVLLAGGVVYLHGVHAARMDASLRARECAWAYANGGCETLPPECRETGGGAADDGGDPALADAVASVQEMQSSFPIPGLGSTGEAIFGRTVRLSATATAQSTPLFPAPPREMEASALGVCNERERTIETVARDVFCSAVSSIGLGGPLGC